MTVQILLVDREPNRCRLLQRWLRRMGITVVSAATPEEAQNALDDPPRIVLMDLGLLCGPDRERIEEVITTTLGLPPRGGELRTEH